MTNGQKDLRKEISVKEEGGDARLFLVRKTLAEKIATSGLLQGVIGFNGEEFPDASADEVAARCRI